ncbi:MAG: low molecular weight protein arginine phosphatase [Actinobacteria bacterium]|nr:MAG: low molecular weight protein arginine phosphatase [Actinomycetota bacterium]
MTPTTNNQQPTIVFNILFVCLGNSCRSPMAEVMFNKYASEAGLKAYSTSAGLMAYSGGRAAENAILTMENRGIDLNNHQSRFIEDEILEEADLILVMEDSQLGEIPERYRDKAHLFTRYSSDVDEDIFDPIGADLSTYRQCADLIHKHMQNLIEKL